MKYSDVVVCKLCACTYIRSMITLTINIVVEVLSFPFRSQAEPNCRFNGLARLGNIDAETLLWRQFNWVKNMCCRPNSATWKLKMFLPQVKNISAFQTQFCVKLSHHENNVD